MQVVEASGLEGDIAAWANGDSFQAGENGQSLSGGQKARVGLARALYSRRPIMLVRSCWRAVTVICNHDGYICGLSAFGFEKRSFQLAEFECALY
jgi:hypothetical protein